MLDAPAMYSLCSAPTHRGKFVAAEDATTVQVDGNSYSLTNAGDFRMVVIPGGRDFSRISADKPIMLAQFSVSLQSGK